MAKLPRSGGKRPADYLARVCAGLAMLAGHVHVYAQATLNHAPRVTLAGVSESVRADTLCVLVAPASALGFADVSVADADVGDGVVHARVELEPAVTSTASVAIPGLADLPGVTIVREEFDRIRFDAPLASVNAAFAALQLSAPAQGDMLDLIVDDLQLPPLGAELRFHFAVEDGADLEITRCRPPPDLRPESDSGESAEDDITAAGFLRFDVTGVTPGDVVVLLDDDVFVSEVVADAPVIIIEDPAPLVATHLYAVSVNGDAGSAAWSVAVESPLLFVDGFEPPPPAR